MPHSNEHHTKIVSEINKRHSIQSNKYSKWIIEMTSSRIPLIVSGRQWNEAYYLVKQEYIIGM